MSNGRELQVQQKREVENKQESTVPGRAFVPVTDIFETDQSLTVVLEMPGVDRESVDVEVADGVLTIEGRINFGKYEGLQPVYTEYNIGNFARSFHLPRDVQHDRIKAQLKDGVMTVTLPKAEKAKPRTIKVG